MAREPDLDRLVEIHTNAFPDPRGHAERIRNFTANPLRSTGSAMGDLWVVTDGPTIVAHAFLFALDVWVAGGTLKVGAIASVGVAPEARGRGIAAAFLAHLQAQADARGACATMLYAFRQGFYARHGYALVTPTRRLHVHPASIPSAWRSEPGLTIRGALAGDRGVIVEAYARSAAAGCGSIVRPDSLWDHFFADDRRVWMLAVRGACVVGYAAWSLAQAEFHAVTRLYVHEIVADDDAVRRALLGAVGAQRNQVAEVEIDLSARDPLDRALVDPDRARFGTPAVEHALGAIVGGPMVRLVDVRRALLARRYAVDGAIDLVIDGEPGVHLAVASGRAELLAARGTSPVTIDRAALGAILVGGLAPTDAARLGWARGDEAHLARADAIFATPPFFALDAY